MHIFLDVLSSYDVSVGNVTECIQKIGCNLRESAAYVGISPEGLMCPVRTKWSPLLSAHLPLHEEDFN